jgi:hypothetical protein
MRITSMLAMLVVTLGVGAGETLAVPVPSPSPPTVDLGSKTSGLAGEEVAQPSPAAKIRIDPNDVIPDRGPDTPGKTGLGNNDHDALGGADKGPGTQDVVPRNAQ